MGLPTPLYLSGTKTGQGWNVAVPVGAAVFSDLLPYPNADKSKLEQDFQQQNDAWTAMAFNTVHAEYPGYYLQAESLRADIGGGMVKWRRTYVKAPTSYDNWENMSYTFPAYPGYLVMPVGVLTPVGRGAFTPPNGVNCRVRYDYYIVGTGQTYASYGLIPPNAVMNYHGLANAYFQINPPMVVGPGTIIVGTLQYLETVPNQTAYQTYVANAVALGWGSGRVGTADANPGQLCISCKSQQIVGNLWAMVSKYILAQ